MTPTRLRLLVLAASALVVGALALPVGPAGAVITPPGPTPHIVAFPDVVRVNGNVLLIGTQFPSHVRVSLDECAQTSWIAPQDPCVTSNSVSVETTAGGWFVAVMRAKACPAPSGPVPTTTASGAPRSCYIGAPAGTGVDVITLRGAVRITVLGT